MKNTSLNFEAVNKTVGDILVGPQIRYRVPRYQRPFAWGKEEILDFWNDLVEEREYFVGSFIFNYEYEESEGFVEIIDGQQRLLTITIFSAVVRDIAREIGEVKYADKMQEKWIAFENFREEESVRVLCGDSTKEFFEKYIQQTGNDIREKKKLTKEEKRIQDAYLFLRERLLNKLTGYSNNIDKKKCLVDFTEKLLGLKVIWIKIQNDVDAYTIFESVNARGVDLSVSDLLKNSIFKEVKSKANVDIAKKTWGVIVENVEAANWELTKFIRYYWLSKYAHIPEKRLFKQIKQKITDYEGFLYDLAKEAELFNLVVVGNEEDFCDIRDGVVIHKALTGIRTMNVSQCFVLFMCLLRNGKK